MRKKKYRELNTVTIKPSKRTERLCLRLTAEELDQLRYIAAIRDTTMTQAVSMGILGLYNQTVEYMKNKDKNLKK